MSVGRSTPFSLPWGIAAAVSGGVVALAAAPPFLGEPLAGGVFRAFSWVCHQLPSRSPHLAGEPIALCHRCMGLLLGLAIGVLAAPVLVRPLARLARRGVSRVPRHHRAAVILLLAALPTTLDWSLGLLGLIDNTPVSRTLSGALLGLAAGFVIGKEFLRRPVSSHPSPHHA